jgi:hypothetical protein
VGNSWEWDCRLEAKVERYKFPQLSAIRSQDLYSNNSCRFVAHLSAKFPSFSQLSALPLALRNEKVLKIQLVQLSLISAARHHLQELFPREPVVGHSGRVHCHKAERLPIMYPHRNRTRVEVEATESSNVLGQPDIDCLWDSRRSADELRQPQGPYLTRHLRRRKIAVIQGVNHSAMKRLPSVTSQEPNRLLLRDWGSVTFHHRCPRKCAHPFAKGVPYK